MTENKLNNFTNNISNDNLVSADTALNNALENKNNSLNEGNLAIKQEPENKEEIILTENLPECLKSLSLVDVFENYRIAPEKLEELKEIHANDNFDDYPKDPTELGNFLKHVEKSLNEEMLLLKASTLSDEEYFERYKKIQIQKGYQLLAEFMIGQDLLKIDRLYGVKKDSKRRAKENKRTKAEIIKERYPHLGPRQIRDFQRLRLPCILEAIREAFDTGKEVTRSLALSTPIKKATSGERESLSSKMKRWYAKPEDFETETKELKLTKEIGATSLFANIGIGTSLLEKNTKIHITVANELEARRAGAHKRLYPHCEMIQGDILDKTVFDSVVKSHKTHKNQMMFISCPCQDASALNTAASKGTTKRSALFKVALDVVEKTLPNYLVFENVPDWLESKPKFALSILDGKTIGDYVIDHLENLGYRVTYGILSACDYGTAENRKRAIILACKKELGRWKFPKKHKFRPTVFEAIGSLPSIEAGETSAKSKWHYGLPLLDHEIEFLKHTPTGCSAWDNSVRYQPKNKSGSNSGASFQRGFSRINPALPSPTITSDSGQISGLSTIHFGRPLSDGTYSDSRVLSIAEILALIGCEPDFLEPLDTPGNSDDDFEVLTWQDKMLTSKDERFIRTVLGEHVCPKLYMDLMTTLPIPANDNNPTADDPLA